MSLIISIVTNLHVPTMTTSLKDILVNHFKSIVTTPYKELILVKGLCIFCMYSYSDHQSCKNIHNILDILPQLEKVSYLAHLIQYVNKCSLLILC